jgi:hypothetical protein
LYIFFEIEIFVTEVEIIFSLLALTTDEAVKLPTPMLALQMTVADAVELCNPVDFRVKEKDPQLVTRIVVGKLPAKVDVGLVLFMGLEEMWRRVEV